MRHKKIRLVNVILLFLRFLKLRSRVMISYQKNYLKWKLKMIKAKTTKKRYLLSFIFFFYFLVMFLSIFMSGGSFGSNQLLSFVIDFLCTGHGGNCCERKRNGNRSNNYNFYWWSRRTTKAGIFLISSLLSISLYTLTVWYIQ